MKMVAEGNNPHVVNMIGCVTLQEPVCLVTEFVIYGDLLTYLTTIRRLVSSYPHSCTTSFVALDILSSVNPCQSESICVQLDHSMLSWIILYQALYQAESTCVNLFQMNEMPSPAEVSEVTQDSTSDKELDTTVLGFTSSPNKVFMHYYPHTYITMIIQMVFGQKSI